MVLSKLKKYVYLLCYEFLYEHLITARSVVYLYTTCAQVLNEIKQSDMTSFSS